MNDDRRHALEAIAFGSDPSVRPGDRLRALELLEGVPEDQATEAGRDWRRWVRSLSGDALEHDLDALLAGTIEAALEQRDETNFPDLLAVFERHAERRARELADADRIDAEVERRAQEKAESMYRSRSFALVGHESAREATDGPLSAETTDASSDDTDGDTDGDVPRLYRHEGRRARSPRRARYARRVPE